MQIWRLAERYVIYIYIYDISRLRVNCVGMKSKYTLMKLGNRLFGNVLVVHPCNINDENYICGEFQEEINP